MRTYPAELPIVFGSDPMLVSMKLWLPIDEGAGSRFNNLIDSQNPGLMTGGAWSGGKPSLDGTDDLITLRRVPVTDFTAIIHYTPTGVSGISPILDQGDILIRQSDDDIIYGATDTLNTDYTDTLTAALTAGEPIAIAVSRTGTTMTIWGFTQSGVATDSFTVSGTALTTNANLIIGSDSREDFVFPALPTLTTENGILINAADDVQIGKGSDSLNSSIVTENWNGIQKTTRIRTSLNFVPGDELTHYFFDNQGTDATTNRERLYIDAAGLLTYVVHDKDSTQHLVSFDVTGWTAGTEHQIVAVIDFNNDRIELYTDGTSRDSTPDNALSSGAIDAIEATTQIGADTSQANQLNGVMTFQIYNRAWTATDVDDDDPGVAFVVDADTLAMGNYSDGVTSISYHHSGKSVSATTSGGVLTTAAGADTSLAVGDDTVIQGPAGDANSGRAVVEAVSDAEVTVGSGIAHAELNGSDERFSVTDAAFPATGLTGAQDITISSWINPDSFSASMMIMSKYLTAGNKRMYQLLVTTGAELEFDVAADGITASFDTTTGMDLEAGLWTHVALSYDASGGTAEVYKNGIWIEQLTGLDNSIADKDPDFAVGMGSDGTSSPFNGSVGPTYLFSDIRTAAEIYADAQDYDKDLSAEGNLICGYTFEDAAGATVIDNVEGTAAGDLTLQGGTTTNYGTHTRETDGAYVQGIEKVGVALDFDGAEYVDCGDPIVDGFAAVSVGAWFNISALTGGDTLVGNFQAADNTAINIDVRTDTRFAWGTKGESSALDSMLSDPGAFVVGEDTYILCTWDGTTKNIYANGVLVGTGGYVDAQLETTVSQNLAIGAYRAGTGRQNITGKIYSVQVFNIAATVADAVWLATNPNATEADIISNTTVSAGEMVLHHNYRNQNLIDVSSDGAGALNGNDGTHSGTPNYVTSAYISRHRMLDIEHGGIGGYTIVGTPTLVDKESDTDSDSLSLHIVSAADDDGVSVAIPASNGDKFYLAQRHEVANGSFEVNVTNGGGGIETGIADATWAALEKIISATGNLTFQWLGEAAADDFNISKVSIIQCVTGDSLEADKYYTRVFNVDTSNVGAEWSGLGADATEVKSGDLYKRDDTADASTADRNRSFADGKIESVAVWDMSMGFEEVQARKDEI